MVNLARPLLLSSIVLTAVSMSSCTNVQQFQRGYLAQYVMTPNKDPLAKGMADHMYFSREGAYGGEGVGGGGCGCN